MKKVRANWLKSTKPEVEKEFESLGQLLSESDYIGFIPNGHTSRYMLLNSGGGAYRGLAARPTGYWSSVEEQKRARGDYYIFDTAIELFDWMKG